MTKIELLKLKRYINDLNNQVGIKKEAYYEIMQKIQEAYNLAPD